MLNSFMIFLSDFPSSFSSIISNLQLESLKPEIRKTSHSANKKISVYGGFYVLIRLAHHDLKNRAVFRQGGDSLAEEECPDSNVFLDTWGITLRLTPC